MSIGPEAIGRTNGATITINLVVLEVKEINTNMKGSSITVGRENEDG